MFKTSLIILFIATNAFAGESIMFQDRDDNYSTEQNVISEDEKKKAHCKELNKQIALLKGKPLRRTELKNRYQEECLSIRRDSSY